MDCKHRNALKIVCEILNKKLENISCSANEVRHLLLKLKPNNSPGPDNIAPCVLRECASELAPSLAHILNKSFSSGLLPNEWKCAEEGLLISRRKLLPVWCPYLVKDIRALESIRRRA